MDVCFIIIAMGNILMQKRHNRQGEQFDNLSYHYQKDANGNLERNRLYHVNDAISAGFDSTDIDDMGAFISAVNQINTDNNYVYDKEGRLVKDRQEEIDTILWTVTGKVKEIKRNLASSKKNLKFEYDAFGRRIAKHVYNNETAMLEKSTYYILDAQGNQLSMYEHSIDESENIAKYYLAERNIYGSSRLGSANDTVNMFVPEILPSYGILGNRQYELSNHLGNVLTTISDVKYPLSNDNISISGYEVGINGISDYSPFGAPLDGRTVGNLGKRGFNSQERDNEVSGKGNSYSAEFWQYSPRLGRRWEIDPVVKPHESPYATFANNPIWFVDIDGADTSFCDNEARETFLKSYNKSKDLIKQVNNEYNDVYQKIRELEYKNKNQGLSKNEKTTLKDLRSNGNALKERLKDLQTIMNDFKTILKKDTPIFEYSSDDEAFDIEEKSTGKKLNGFVSSVVTERETSDGIKKQIIHIYVRTHQDATNIHENRHGVQLLNGDFDNILDMEYDAYKVEGAYNPDGMEQFRQNAYQLYKENANPALIIPFESFNLQRAVQQIVKGNRFH